MGKKRRPSLCSNCWRFCLQNPQRCKDSVQTRGILHFPEVLFSTRSLQRVSYIKHRFCARSISTGCFPSIRNPSGVWNHLKRGHFFPHRFTKRMSRTYHPVTHLRCRHLCICGAKHVYTREQRTQPRTAFLRLSQESCSNIYFFPPQEVFQENEITLGFIKILSGNVCICSENSKSFDQTMQITKM